MMPTKVWERKCSVCGNSANLKTKISPEGHILCNRKFGFTEFEEFFYCKTHYQTIAAQFWDKIQNKIP